MIPQARLFILHRETGGSKEKIGRRSDFAVMPP
jgi:hypothetical protein